VIKVANNLKKLFEKRSMDPSIMILPSVAGILTSIGISAYLYNKAVKGGRKQLNQLEKNKQNRKPMSAQDKANYDVLKDFEAGGEI
jgi:hypothetical protein